MSNQDKINDLEFPVKNILASKDFFTTVFGWEFEDFGFEYSALKNAGLDGGFYTSDLKVSAEKGSVPVVLYSANLEETQHQVKTTGGKICKAILSFPGGQRFHFTDPRGNEFAVWSDHV